MGVKWRIPQFKTVGLPTMGAYREHANCRAASALLMSLTNASRLTRCRRQWRFCAVYQRAGWGNVPRDCQTVRVARSPSDDVNGTRKRSREWSAFTRRISARVYSYHQNDGLAHCAESSGRSALTLKSGIAAPRSPVNNCGKPPVVILRYRLPHLLSMPQQC